MRHKGLSLGVLLCASTCIAGLAHAQTFTVPIAPTPPVRSSIDARGVDLISGSFNLSETLLSIGQAGAGGLSRTRQGDVLNDGYEGTVNVNGSVYTVSIGGSSETFTLSGGTFVSNQAQGSTLTVSGGVYTYTLSDGSVIQYSTSFGGNGTSTSAPLARMTSIATPDGEVDTINYRSGTIAYDTHSMGGVVNLKFTRIQSVTNNFGYQLKYNYSSNTLSTVNDISAWNLRTGYQAINNAIDYCAPTADTCSVTQTWPSLTVSGNAVTDALARTTTYAITTTANSTSTITRPSGAAITIVRDGASRVASWSNGVGTWTYAYSDSGTTRTTTVTDPLGHQRVVTSNTNLLVVLSDKNALNNTTSYEYDTSGRMTKATAPEGNSVSYTYDARGNLTQTTVTPKAGSGLAPAIVTAGYDATCANVKTCNQPNWTKDALGNQTDYTYDATHGGVLTVTAPAGTNGVRPQTRYSYAQIPTYAKNSSGATVQIGSIWAMTGTSVCATGSSCAGTADEIKTTITRAAATNLLPAAVTKGSGDGTLSATTSLTYDNVGDVQTVDGPLAGTADTIRYRRDAARQLLGVVGVDPDGGGPLKYRAVRYSYDADGRPTIVEQGTVNSLSDADWAAMSVLQQGLTKYDAIGRPTHQALNAGGAIQSVIQLSYDAANRRTCSIIRMNPSVFGAWPNFSSLPASACDQGTAGSDGPDRITYNTYDNADQLVQVTAAYGSSAARTEKYAYLPNGTIGLVTDGANNTTSFSYDGFDRLTYTHYPVTAVGAQQANGADYDLYGYDAAGNRTSWRRRDGNTINFSYDALGRLTYKDAPKGWYYYDNLNRPTYTYAGDNAEQVMLQYYDALSRPTVAYDYRGGNWVPLTSTYDLAGRRTRLQWSDGFYVDYDYDLSGAMTAIRESGSFTLAAYTYDDLGRRTAANRANSAQTYYGYDAASRLASLTLDLAGTAQDQAYGFTYNAAGQIKTRTSSNDAYRWAGGGAVSRSYTINGLNQAITSGPNTVTYGGKGNLGCDAWNAGAGSCQGRSYGYDLASRLTTVSGGGNATLYYDPADRLGQISGATTTKFLYSGSDLVGELDGSNNLVRRYIPGPGGDEPVVWYEGAGVGDRRWLLADERGSVVAVTNGSGAASTINTYDEYGVPGAGNVGRYQYTGQTFVSELGVYNYKARMYSPTLGRFMQPDPIGYGDGMNWYAYVSNDPVNRKDPSGMVSPIEVSFIRDWNWIDRFGDFFYRGVLGRGGRDVSAPSLDGPTQVSAVEVTAPKKKTVKDNYRCHAEAVMAKAMALQAAGYSVTFNVGFRDPQNDGRMIVADIVAGRVGITRDSFDGGNPLNNPELIIEVKTGDGPYRPNQRVTYPKFGTPATLVPVGFNAFLAGFPTGVPIGVERFEFQEARYPGC